MRGRPHFLELGDPPCPAICAFGTELWQQCSLVGQSNHKYMLDGIHASTFALWCVVPEIACPRDTNVILILSWEHAAL